MIGYSDRKPPADDLLDFITDFSLRVADRLGIREFSLIGSFMFGAVSMNMARKAPDRVRNLVLLAPLGIVQTPVTFMMRAIIFFYRLPGMPFFLRIRPFRAVVEWIDHYLIGPRRLYQIFYEPKKVPVSLEDLYEHYKKPRVAFAALALIWAIRKMNYAKLVSRLDEVKCPALIVHGAEDVWIPARYPRELQSRLSKATLVEIPDARHAPELEKVDLTCEHVLRFLEKNSESAQKTKGDGII